MNNYQKIAELLYPNNKYTVEEILKKYPKRNLDKNQVVSRYAPSPTGYMHLGNFFQMFISYNLTRVTDGVFFLRIEDTDAKREKKDATQVIYEILDNFGIKANEYQTLEGEDIGDYGPYVQSQRVEIYKAFAKKLVSEGKAFPCFCRKTEGKEDVLKLREHKFENDDLKEYDPCRDLSYEEVEANIKEGKPFAIRLKTKNTGTERVKFYDLIKGEIDTKANAKDIILVKSDGVPPYAFAHAIDDTLMGTTIVVRGEEYISSTPSHMEIFDALGFDYVTYCHNPLICKIGEEGNRRKISKRYDPEADMRYYFEEGYPIESVLEYLLNLINSGFENWRRENPDLSWKEFKFGVNDITAVAPIFDLVKLNDISKNLISRMNKVDVYNGALLWAEKYDSEFAGLLKEHKNLAIEMLNIDREIERPRKDIAKYKDVRELYLYFFNEIFDKKELLNFDTKYAKESIVKFLSKYKSKIDLTVQKDVWFAGVKEIAGSCGFATDNKAYKANPSAYAGNVADACTILRVAITGRTQTPDLYSIMQTLKYDEVISRIEYVLENLK
ncbi:MAG: glutamate--tRNA ligase, partial [Clostridia bacterium]|nr:glutamate--tRNA ligase [Clostridia bacterium]